MISEGGLCLDVGWNGKKVTAAEIRSTRPWGACRVLEGRSIAQALTTMPLLFGVCGRSHTVAAAMALEAAVGFHPPGQVRRMRELVLAAECAHEHLWRLLLDLPALLGVPPEEEGFVAMRRSFEDVRHTVVSRTAWWKETDEQHDLRAWRELGGDLAAFLTAEVFGLELERFLALDGARRARWLRAGRGAAARLLGRVWKGPRGRSDVALMVVPEEIALCGEIAAALDLDDGFAAIPTRDGAPRETGALAREAGQAPVAAALAKRGNTVGVRILARLTELARLVPRIRALCYGGAVTPWSRAAQLRSGGIAAVETARGVLMHRVVLDGTKVERYRIVAPTEWNFHPAGAFAKGLVGHAARDAGAVQQVAALLAHALDPCVGYEIRVKHA